MRVGTGMCAFIYLRPHSIKEETEIWGVGVKNNFREVNLTTLDCRSSIGMLTQIDLSTKALSSITAVIWKKERKQPPSI